MKRWRAVLGMRSPLARPLTAGRLFGHVCWGLAWREGPQAVSGFLARMAGEEPPLVLGEPAPVNFAAMPVVLRDGTIAPDVAGKRLGLWNTYRRAGLMPRAALLAAARGLTPANLREALDADGWPRPVRARREMRVRSGANRLDGSPLDRSEWLAVECWDESHAGQVEVLIAGAAEAAEVERLLRMGLEHGMGRAAAVGYGQVELVSLEEMDWPQIEGADALVTLGPCVPKRGDPAGGTWRVRTHWGKVGGGFSVGATAAEKRPVVELKAGAVLREQGSRFGVQGQQTAVAGGQWLVASEQQRQEGGAGEQSGGGSQGLEGKAFVGRLVPGVLPGRPEVVHYGLAPVVAVRTAVPSAES